MRRRLPAMVLLPAALAFAGALRATERPEWAKKVPVYGALAAAETLPGDVPRLAKGSHRFAAQDGKGRIYLLSASSREVAVFKPDGTAWDGFVLPPPREPIRKAGGFAVDSRGETFAVLDGARVHLLSRDGAVGEVELPFVGTDVAFDGDELLVSRAPARMVRREGRSGFETDPEVVLRFTPEGEPDGVAWRAGAIEGPNPGVAAMTHLFLIAAAPHHGLWIGRRAGTLWLADTLRGEITAEWTDETVGEPPSYPGSPPESLRKDLSAFTKEAQAKARFWHAPVTIRDLAVHDGLAWVLLRAGVLAEAPVVAVYDPDRPAPLAYLELGGPVADFADLAVTDDALWVIPRMGEEPIQYFERVPDPVLLEMVQSWDRRHGDGAGSDGDTARPEPPVERPDSQPMPAGKGGP